MRARDWTRGIRPLTSMKNALSAMIGLAMLTLPASALAGHHPCDWEDNPRPFAWHDQGWHRGWLKHQGYGRPAYVRPIEDEDDEDEQSRFRPEPMPPALSCDEDGDDCEPVDQGYSEDNEYGSPISYNGVEPSTGYSLIQQRDWLIQRRQRADYVLRLMRARHDGRAARRISTVIHSLDARIARDNQLLAGGGYVPTPAPYYGAAFNPNYLANSRAYNPNYPANPNVNPLTTMVGPLLGLPSY
jgi:hypothetical protein